MVSKKPYYRSIANLLKQFDHHIIKYQAAVAVNNVGLLSYYRKEIDDFIAQIRLKFEFLNPNQEQTKQLQQEFENMLLIYQNLI